LPRGKKKPHDEFRDWTYHALVWIKENWQTAVEIVAVAAVVFAVVVGANTYWRHRSQAAADMLYAARQAGLESEDAKVAKLEELVSKYSRTPAGQQAMMQLGQIFLKRNDFDKAAEEFRTLAGKSRNRPIFMIAALHRLAATELSKGDVTAAAETYLKAAADPHNLVALVSRYRAAGCFEKAGDFERAAQLYRQVIDEAGVEDRMVRELSEERLLWLSANKHIES
jgi:predicted negative regulator of RcsB-dependent stress response